VQAVDLLVGGEEDEGVEALAEHAVGQVEEAPEPGSGIATRRGPQVLVAVLGDDEPPPFSGPMQRAFGRARGSWVPGEDDLSGEPRRF